MEVVPWYLEGGDVNILTAQAAIGPLAVTTYIHTG